MIEVNFRENSVSNLITGRRTRTNAENNERHSDEKQQRSQGDKLHSRTPFFA